MSKHGKFSALLSALLFTLLSTAGCGSDSSERGVDGGPHSSDDFESQAYGGDLTGLVRRMTRSSAWHSCDDSDQGLRAEIAAVLDLRRDEIAAYVAAHPAGSTGYQRRVYGPLTMREPLEAPRPADRWHDDAEPSWNEMSEELRRVQYLPVNSSWVRFNSMVRDLIKDDEMRLINRVNMDIRRVEIPLILSLDRLLSSCHRRSDCVRPDFDEPLLAFIARVPEYQRRLQSIDDARSFAAQREALVSWSAWVEADAADYRFSPHLAARRVSRRVLELHLDPGALTAAADRVKEAIEAAWRTTRFHVEVVWSPGVHAHIMDGSLAIDEPHPYLLEFSPEVGSRAYVTHSRRVMRVYDDVRLTTFAHEAGHVLGFPDRYYPRFDRTQCRYYVESNEADIMSSSATGHVSAEDFQTLKDSYPL